MTPLGPDRTYAQGNGGPGDYDDGRLSAPAALRNRAAITEALTAIAPANGRALEIASGTGEHIIRFAAAMPGLMWQPSDPNPDRRASITAWSRAEPQANLAPPVDLDASAPGWAADHGPVDLIFLANLLHLISTPAAENVLAEIAAALAPGGLAALYGPYLRDGQATSDGDAAFDARIRSEMPEAGYKDRAWVEDRLTRAGLITRDAKPMPANNLLVLAQKPT